jgi:hypothetical protein
MILEPGESNLKGWIAEAGMSGRMQSALLAALRGADSDDSPEVKRVVRWVRKQCLKEVNPSSHFMRDVEFVEIKAMIYQDSWQWDRLTCHFRNHLKRALSILAYFHPDEWTQARALKAYEDLQMYGSPTPGLIMSKAELIGEMRDSMPIARGELVVNDWILQLPGHMQSALECSLRGSDIMTDDEVRRVTHWMRWVVMKNVHPTSHYMADREFMRIKTTNKLHPSTWETLPSHFVHHLGEAMEIVGYLHPDAEIQARALQAYEDICEKSKAKPEPKDALLLRMQDKPGQVYEVVQQRTNLPIG